jgi:protein-S-isoprenylcysteine O-methyltransferase Ste14
LYKHVRHPLYIGWATAFWAIPTMTVGHLLFAGGMTVYMGLAAIVEERDLITLFGQHYVRYQRQVPMFLPRLRPRVVAGSIEAPVGALVTDLEVEVNHIH